MAAPVIIKNIPNQKVNERTPFGPIALYEFIQVSEGEAASFRAALRDGDTLPVGITCTAQGMMMGFPGVRTQGTYEVVVTAENAEGSVEMAFNLTIEPAATAASESEIENTNIVNTVPAPILVKPIPTQVINEGAAYGPFSFKAFFEIAAEDTPRFHAELKSGQALPQGMICTPDGVLTGIPANGTQGNHEVIITAESKGGAVQATFILTIKPAPITHHEEDYLGKLKAQVWEALEHRLPPPDIAALYEQTITESDIAYLLDRWGFLAVWDAFNLDAPCEKMLLTLEGVSPHYNVYDRGSCIVACPKDLFSYERTIEDSLQTARAVAREVYKRNWTVELTGISKMTRAAWVEIQHLGDHYGRHLEVVNFSPSPDDVSIYAGQVSQRRLET
jgi:hypothetical protein